MRMLLTASYYSLPRPLTELSDLAQIMTDPPTKGSAVVHCMLINRHRQRLSVQSAGRPQERGPSRDRREPSGPEDRLNVIERPDLGPNADPSAAIASPHPTAGLGQIFGMHRSCASRSVASLLSMLPLRIPLTGRRRTKFRPTDGARSKRMKGCGGDATPSSRKHARRC